MSDRPLLLSPARSGVIVRKNPIPRWLRFAVSAVGVVVIVAGAADIVTRFSNAYRMHTSSFLAVGPVIAIEQGANVPVVPVGLAPATTTPIIPVRIIIEAIGVDAVVEAVALKSDNITMAAPASFETVAWYEPGVMPGQEGRAVFAGHLNSPILGREGIFSALSNIGRGDVVILSDSEGRSLRYQIFSIDEYANDLAPTEEIFSREGPSEIVLITCEGQWNPALRTFDNRLVVIGRLMP